MSVRIHRDEKTGSKRSELAFISAASLQQLFAQPTMIYASDAAVVNEHQSCVGKNHEFQLIRRQFDGIKGTFYIDTDRLVGDGFVIWKRTEDSTLR